MTISPVHSIVDGVRIVLVPRADEGCRARLVFGVGDRDETVPTRGTLHLIEHLALHPLRHSSVDFNGVVDQVTMQFFIEGRAASVGRFLTDLSRSLHDLPVHRQHTEARILRTELEDSGPGPAEALKVARFGHRDLGLGVAWAPDPARLDPTSVSRFASRWLKSTNAVLLVVGELPNDLTLPLPPGPAPDRAWPAPRRWSRPSVLTTAPDGALAASLLLPARTAARPHVLAAAIVERRIREAVRHEAGLAYGIGGELLPAAGGLLSYLVSVDPAFPHAREAAQVVVPTLLTLLRSGPSQDELDWAKSTAAEHIATFEGELAMSAGDEVDRLLGLDVPAFDRRAHDALTVEELRSYLAGVADDVVLAIDPATVEVVTALGVEPTPAVAAAANPIRVEHTYRPSLLTRARDGDARSSVLGVGTSGVVFDGPEGHNEVRWDDVVALIHEPEEDLWTLLGADGSFVPLGSKVWWGGNAVLQMARDRVPPTLVYEHDKDGPDRPVRS